MRRIIDTKYEKVDLIKVITKQCKNLSTKELERLLTLIRKFEDIFDGTLGTRKNTPVYLELKDDEKLVWLRPYPVPRVHEEMSIMNSKDL